MTDRPIGLLLDGRETLTRDEHLMRATPIFQRENGAWKVVHPHTSLGVPNAEVPAFADNPERAIIARSAHGRSAPPARVRWRRNRTGGVIAPAA